MDKTFAYIYMIGSAFCALSFTLYKTKKVDFIYYTMIYIFLRNSLRMLDLEQTRPVISYEQWQTIFILQIICSVMNIIYLAKCFPSDKSRRIVVYLLSLFFAFCIFCGIIG